MSLQTIKSIDHTRTLTSMNFNDSTVFQRTREIFFVYIYIENVAHIIPIPVFYVHFVKSHWIITGNTGHWY